MSAVLHKKAFPDLTVDELYELLRVRSEVFVVEQDCVYQDMDGDDQASIHLWLTEDDKVVALCRVCPAGTHMHEISIGRVITTERRKGYGKRIMLEGIAAAREHFDAKVIDIEAQESTSKPRNTRRAFMSRWVSASPPNPSSWTASRTSR